MSQTGYASTLRSEILLKSAHDTDRHPTEIADLVGKRLVAVHELGGIGRKFNDGLVKQLTGSDLITARRIRENSFQFSPTHTFFVLANVTPHSDDPTEAMLRRLDLIPTHATFADASAPIVASLGTEGVRFDRQDDFPFLLTPERPGILAWLVQGARMYFERGIPRCNAVTAANGRYRERVDHLKSFLAACTVRESGAFVSSSGFYDTYQGWCNDHDVEGDERIFNPIIFGRRIADVGYRQHKGTAGIRGFIGLRLKA